MLPLFEAVMKQKFKLVHVIRDGRDISLGDNRGMMNALCERIFSTEQVENGYCVNDVNPHNLDEEFENATMNNVSSEFLPNSLGITTTVLATILGTS